MIENSDPMQSRVINFIHEGIDVKTPKKNKEIPSSIFYANAAKWGAKNDCRLTHSAPPPPKLE